MRPSSTRESNAKKISTKSNLSPFDKSKARSLTPPSYGISAADNPQPLQAKFGNSFGRSGTLKRKGETGLPTQLKARMEQMGGVDLSDVKVSYNSSKPQQIGALAYTRGNQIEIGPGQERHLAHEAWHSVQQKQGRVTPTTTLGKGLHVNNDAALEKEADVMGARAMQGNLTSKNDINGGQTRNSRKSVLQMKEAKESTFAKPLDNIIYLIDVGGHQSGKEPNLIEIAKKTNAMLYKLGVETRVVVFQDPKIFNKMFLDKNDGVALIGGAKNILNFAKVQVSDVYADAALKSGFLTNIYNPEKSSKATEKVYKEAGGLANIIGLESTRIFNLGTIIYGDNKNNKENAIKNSAFSLAHGVGHNSGIDHIFAGVMTKGSEIKMARYSGVGNSITNPIEYLLKKEHTANNKYEQAVNTHFGSTPAKSNYGLNKKRFLEDSKKARNIRYRKK